MHYNKQNEIQLEFYFKSRQINTPQATFTYISIAEAGEVGTFHQGEEEGNYHPVVAEEEQIHFP